MKNSSISNLPSYASIADTLLEAMEGFDAKISPQGLYAAEEHGVEVPRKRWALEWEACLMPALQSMGCKFPHQGKLNYNGPAYNLKAIAEAAFQIFPNQTIWLHMARVSKIKVRKYGNSFRVDPHLDFSERWKEFPLATFLKHDAPTATTQHLFLLLAFDLHQKPFQKELTELKCQRDWEHFGWTLHTRTWSDPHKRAFNTRASLWAPTLTPYL